MGGGNPNITVPQIPAAAPSPTPAAPQEVAPPPVAEKADPPPKETAKPPEKNVEEPPVKPPEPKPDREPEPKPREPDPDSFDLSKAVKKTVTAKPEKAVTSFDFNKAEKKVIRPVKNAREGKEDSDAEENSRAAREKQVASARAGALSDVMKRVQGGLSSVGGSYDVPGPGGNSMSYIFALQKRYRDAWVGATTSGRNGVQVEIEIAKDGTVVSSRIVKRSGNSDYDRAAQRTIDRVKKVDPLPEGTKEAKRTYRFEITPNELDRG